MPRSSTPARSKSKSAAKGNQPKTPMARKPTAAASFGDSDAKKIVRHGTPMTNVASDEEQAKMSKLSDYKSPEPSLLSKYIFFPFYDWIVQYFPRAWVPNYITAFGIACTLVSSCMLFSCFPADAKFLVNEGQGYRLFRGSGNLSTANNQLQMEAPVEYLPAAVTAIFNKHIGCITAIFFFVAGILNGVYCTADNTDGRQARRTKQTSFIGEYLDHGLDCVTALLSCFVMTVILGETLNAAMATTAAIALVTCLSHVLHHSNNIFIWGNSVVTVDEAMVGFAAAPIARAFLIPAGGLGQFIIPAEYLNFVTDCVKEVPFVGTLAAKYIGSLSGCAIVDIVVLAFMLAQVGMVRDLLSFNRSNAFSGAWITLWIVTAIFFALAMDGQHQDMASAYHGFGTLSFVPRGLLTYPALWATTYCFIASIITHIPILAQCARVKAQDFWPLSLVFGAVFSFLVSPLYGCAFSIVAHAVQIWYNINVIQRLAAKRAAKATQE